MECPNVCNVPMYKWFYGGAYSRRIADWTPFISPVDNRLQETIAIKIVCFLSQGYLDKVNKLDVNWPYLTWDFSHLGRSFWLKISRFGSTKTGAENAIKRGNHFLLSWQSMAFLRGHFAVKLWTFCRLTDHSPSSEAAILKKVGPKSQPGETTMHCVLGARLRAATTAATHVHQKTLEFDKLRVSLKIGTVLQHFCQGSSSAGVARRLFLLLLNIPVATKTTTWLATDKTKAKRPCLD